MTIAVALTLVILLLHRHASASDDEIRSLLEFRKGIKSDPSGRVFSTWSAPSNLSACPDGFHGVVCDAAAASVVGISLDGLGIVGDLKFSTLVPLKSLQNLTLSGNSFTGRLVPAIGTMLSLQVIDLSGNQFYGPVPDRLHNLWELHYLNLSGNSFSGGFPDGIRNLQQLRVLDLRSNDLHGDVQELIPQLRNVEYLDLSRNRFFGSMEFGVENVSSLANTVKYVNLSGNSLGGGLWGAEAMKLFRNLQVLDLGDNGIIGQLPEFGQLPSLRTLRLGSNQLFGSVPEELVQGGIPLVELDLSVNGFSGPIPIINSTTLATLNLSSNSMSGSLPPSLGNCLVVDLSSNLLSDNMSVLTNYNPNLESLDLSSNALTGSLPNLTQFQSLTFLSISNNSLDGSLPSSLGSKLTAVDLSSNIFNGSIPASFFTSVTITNLNLSGNHLTGPIPIQLSPASVLLVLPTIPPMESLDLSSNALSDGLPSIIGNWGRLKLLNLAGNNLSGQLPSELSKLTVLELLDLSHNSFNGQIPDRLPSTLKFFNVSYNYLSGKIPENLISFPGSSFKPGNSELETQTLFSSPNNGRNHHNSKSSIEVAVIVVCSLVVLMIVFLLFAYRLTRLRNSPAPEVSGDDVKVGRLSFSLPSLFNFNHRNTTEQHPTSLSHSNNHLLTPSFSHQMEAIGEIVPAGVGTSPTTSERKYSSDSPIATSPVKLKVYSPDRFSGDLFFLDESIVFTAEELSRAPAEILGRSSHGTLYKATLDNRRVLTVKWLRVGLVKKKKDFAKEVKKMGSVNHPNAVQLRAYYWGPMEQERLILADYVPGDSLALHLYESTPRRYSPLSFSQRLRVAIDVAGCLVFLHDRGIPHGNLKPTNVILSSSGSTEYSVRLTDYGLHRLMTNAGIWEQILNLGALGYRAPELGNVSKPIPSFKGDVYGLGVIMMELLTRKSAGDILEAKSGAVDLTDWVRKCDREERRMDCVDKDMVEREKESRGGFEGMLGVSLRCILPVNERPNMRQVLDSLCSVSAAL